MSQMNGHWSVEFMLHCTKFSAELKFPYINFYTYAMLQKCYTEQLKMYMYTNV